MRGALRGCDCSHLQDYANHLSSNFLSFVFWGRNGCLGGEEEEEEELTIVWWGGGGEGGGDGGMWSEREGMGGCGVRGRGWCCMKGGVERVGEWSVCEWAGHVNRARGHDPYVPLDGGQGNQRAAGGERAPLHAPFTIIIIANIYKKIDRWSLFSGFACVWCYEM